MSGNKGPGSPRQDPAWVTAAELGQARDCPYSTVERAEVLTFLGGRLTTSEHPDLLAAAIGDIAHRHGVRIPATANPQHPTP
jgi:hypothetical protein